MEHRIYLTYWRLRERGYGRTAWLLDVMAKRPAPKFYAAAALLGIMGGFIGGMSY